MDDGLHQIAFGLQASFLLGLIVAEVQEEQHEDPGLRIEAHEGDETHPHGDAHVVAQGPEQPEGADGAEGHRQHHHGGLEGRLGVGVEQAEDQHQRDGQNDLQPLLHADHVLVLARPGEAVARGQLQLLLHGGLGVLHVGAHVDLRGVEVHQDIAVHLAVLVPDHGRARHPLQVRDGLHGDQGAPGRGNEHPPQGIWALPVVAGVADVHRVPGPPVEDRALVVPADGGHHQHVRLLDAEPVAGQGLPLEHEVQEVALGRALGEGAAGARHALEDALGVHGHLLDGLQVGSVDLEAHGGADAGAEHVQAGLDGHGPGVGDGREPHHPVQVRDDVLLGDPVPPQGAQDALQEVRSPGTVPARLLAPLVLGLEDDHGLHHGEGRRIRGRVGAARLAEDPGHLGHGADEAVLHLEDLLCLGLAQPRQRGGHVEQGPLVQGRHELAAQGDEGRDGGQDQQRGHGDGGLGVAQHEAAGPFVDPVEEDADGMPLLRVVLADDDLGGRPGQPPRLEAEGFHPGEHHAHGRIQGQRQQRRDAHGQVLGVGQRLEQAALLIQQGEDGHEAHRHHQQGEEDTGPHFHQGLQAHLVEASRLPGFYPFLNLLVGVLHLDDGAIHQHADGDGDARQAHEVGVLADAIERDEGQAHAHGDRHDGHDGRGHVPQEDQDDDRDDDHLLDELVLHGLDGLVDQLGAVVDRDHLHAGRQAQLQLVDLRLDPFDHVQGVLTLAHHHDATDRVAHTVQVREAAPHLGTQAHGGHVAQPHRGAVLRPEGRLLQILGGLHVAPAPDHVLASAVLHEAPARLGVGGLDRPDDGLDGHPVGGHLVGVERHLELLGLAAHRGHLGHARRALDGIAQEPVLEGSQLIRAVLPGAVHQGVLIHPAHGAGIGPQRGLHAGRQGGGDLAEVLQGAAAGPVDVRAVLEDHVDIGEAEVREAPHGLHLRGPQQAGDDGVGDLVLHEVRASVPF